MMHVEMKIWEIQEVTENCNYLILEFFFGLKWKTIPAARIKEEAS